MGTVTPDDINRALVRLYHEFNGPGLARLLDLRSDSARKQAEYLASLPAGMGEAFASNKHPAWRDMTARRGETLVYLYIKNDMQAAFASHCEFIERFSKFITQQLTDNPGRTQWMMDAMYRINKNLVLMASILQRRTGTPAALETCAIVLQKCFSLCLNDRTSDHLESTNKIGTYCLASLLLKTYIKLRKWSLGENIVKSIAAVPLPDFDFFPVGHRVAYKYYIGQIAFLQHNYAGALRDLEYALQNCHHRHAHNIRIILRPLTALKLRQGSLPSHVLRSLDPVVEQHYVPAAKALQKGDIARLMAHIESDRTWLVQRHVFSIVEGLQTPVLRTYIKHCWIAVGRPQHLNVSLVHKFFLLLPGFNGDIQETEWLIVHLIARGYIRGYISQHHKIAVLAKTNAFPALTAMQ